MTVQNTSNHAFNILSIAGTMFFTENGQEFEIGTVSDFTPVEVAPVSQQTVDIEVGLSITGVVSDIMTMLATGIQVPSVRLAAMANVDQLQVPLNYSYKLV